jgi:hypothetical protein
MNEPLHAASVERFTAYVGTREPPSPALRRLKTCFQQTLVASQRIGGSLKARGQASAANSGTFQCRLNREIRWNKVKKNEELKKT